MAGSCKPDKRLLNSKKEGNIIFGEYVTLQGSAANLIDGQLTNSFCNNGFLLDRYQGRQYIVFTITAECSIWAITGHFYDGGGQPDRPVNLYKVDTGQFLGTFATAIGGFGVWYKMFSNLLPGKYMVENTTGYAAWQEWYVEENTLHKLYRSNNAVYGMRPVQ